MTDATLIVVGILSEALDIQVSTDMPPKDRTSRYVLVDLSGDQSDEFILRPRYALTCWGRSDKDAHGIALAALDALQRASEEHPYLSSCELETMSRDEWSRNGQSRYLVEVNLTINTDE